MENNDATKLDLIERQVGQIFDEIMNELENMDLQVFEPMIKFTPVSEEWDG